MQQLGGQAGQGAGNLWRHRDFLRLWTAETISQLGSQMTLLALPFIAITVVHAGVLELSVLGALELLPFVLLGLPAGAWIDRVAHRPILIVTDLARAVVLASVPLAYLLNALTITQLYLVAFAVGSLTVFFDVAYEALLPALVPRHQLVDGNAKLELSRSAASIAGPSIAGSLVSLASAPLAIVMDAASFVGSAWFVYRIRARDSAALGPRAAPATVRHDIKEGLRYVLGQRYLRPIAACTATSNFFLAMTGAVLLLYLVREVHLSAAQTGLVFGIGNLGFLVGAVISERSATRLGIGPALIVAMVIGGLAGLLIPLAPAALAPVFVAIAQLLSGLATTMYNINQVSLRQAIAPDRMRGRINATMRFLVWGTLPVGSIAGGVLAREIGMRSTLWIAALGGCAAFLCILLSPIRSLVSLSMLDREEEQEGDVSSSINDE